MNYPDQKSSSYPQARLLLFLAPVLLRAAISPDLLESKSFLRRDHETMRSQELSNASGDNKSSSPRPMLFLGTIDTCGGTTYDIQFNGPAAQTIVYDPEFGIHAVWMYSHGNPAVDRNMRWNFFDPTLNPPAWSYNQGPDHMLWGINWFEHRSGFGMLDVNPQTRTSYVSAHYLAGTGELAPTVGADAIPGGGSPQECMGSPAADGYIWPAIGVTFSGKLHTAVMDEATGTELCYSKVDPWCTWSAPQAVHGSQPDAGFPDYNITASKQSSKVAILWAAMNANPPTEPLYGFYCLSTDDGVTWDEPVGFGPPQVFTPGSETLPSFDITSLYGIFDSQDNLHIVGQVLPFFSGEGLHILPAVVCHYTPAGGWSVIHRAESDTLSAPVGSNAAYAGRPSIAEGRDGELVCVWEQFDSLNVESNTDLLRADILAARSLDGGVSWGPAIRVATAGTSSLRFPCVAPRIVADTVHILYLQDLEAGDAATSGQGTITNNPIVHQKFWSGLLPTGVAENLDNPPARYGSLTVQPSLFRDRTVLQLRLPCASLVSVVILDVLGRPVRTIPTSYLPAGIHEMTWDGCSEDGTPVAPGSYFCTVSMGASRLISQVARLR